MDTVFLVWECDCRFEPMEKTLHLVFSNEEQAVAEAQRQGKAAYARETRDDGFSYTIYEVEEWDLIAEVVE